MDDAGVAGACFMLELADGFKERLAFNVAYRTPTSMMAISVRESDSLEKLR